MPYDKLAFTNKVAIVTGGGNGIGKETAKLLAVRGAKVAVIDIDEAAAAAVSRDIAASGGIAFSLRVDVGKSVELKRMVETTIERFGALHILFNNAFSNVLGSVEQLTEDDWDRTQDVTLKSVFLGCKYAIPYIRKAGGGAVVNTSSMHAITGFRGFAAYQAAKGGVCALTRQMAMDYGRHGIRVNAVLPGPTQTAAFSAVPRSYAEKCAKRMPILRLGQAEEVAEVVVFLASDAASLVTGVSLPVDGGATIVGEPDWLTDTVEILPQD